MSRHIGLLWLLFVLGCGLFGPRALRVELDPASLAQARAAMDAAEALQRALAEDRLDPESAERAARALAKVQAPPLAGAVHDGAHAAEAVAAAPDVAAARDAYGRLMESLFLLAAADPRLQEGWQTYRCPMAEGFPKWFQREGEMANPYMGQAMLQCGFPEGWGEAEARPEPAHAGGDDIAYYTCPMHPSVRSDDPATPCPICGMGLTPVSRAALQSGEVIVDGIRRQKLGIRTELVRREALDPTLRAVGQVAADEAKRTALVARVAGYVERLTVAEPGRVVRRGEAVAELYSPELWTTAQELSRGPGAARRLEQWGIDAADLRGDRARLRAPASGVVRAVDVTSGDRVVPGQRLLEIVDVSTVWLELTVPDDDAGRVAEGQAVRVWAEGVPAQEAVVGRVLPWVDDGSRAVRVRVPLANEDGRWRLGAWATAELTVPTEPALLVPRDAVIVAGDRRVVFVDRGEDRLVPVDVTVGQRGAERVEVLDGLVEGDRVVSGGVFLVAAESRLQAAMGFWAQEARHAP